MGLLVQSGLGTGEEERESSWWRDEERRRERECLMEERENKVTGLRGVKLVQDTCHILNGEFRVRAATQVAAKLCPLISASNFNLL